jgi:hypothetical protein
MCGLVAPQWPPTARVRCLRRTAAALDAALNAEQPAAVAAASRLPRSMHSAWTPSSTGSRSPCSMPPTWTPPAAGRGRRRLDALALDTAALDAEQHGPSIIEP